MNAQSASRRGRLLTSLSVFSLSMLGAFAAAPAAAQEAEGEEIVVTGTRRAMSVQDVPVNIAVVGAAEIDEQGLNDLTEVSQWVPGVHIVDQGGRGASRIVVRGLNADPIGASEGLGNDGGGTVATYLGEIPLYIDLRLNDMERVEFLLGPQGTLYGAGTLGGAIRYIPRRPQFDAPSVEVRGDAYQYSEADSLSTDFGVTFNAPITDRFAVRLVVDYLDDSGFVDYNYVVQEPGVSLANFDFSDPALRAANLRPVADANTEDVLSGRIAARLAPTDWLDATLTYYWQDSNVGSRQISSRRSTIPTGEYESALRVLEPNHRFNDLLALEFTADLGFAELTSATGFSRYEELGQRDQTDLLITLEYSYEAFPSFTAFTEERQDDERFNQELRLVSTHEGPFQWIVGAFYNSLDSYAYSKEFTPFYDNFLVGFDARPDNLEYYSVGTEYLKESAVFGELTYSLTDRWDVTAGGRWYSYELETEQAVDFPLLNTVFFGAGPDEINLVFEPGGQSDEGFLYKFNTSYEVTDDLLLYLTVSEGYRIGNSNGVAPCPDPLPPNQIACALPNELFFTPDSTTNYEIGYRSQWFDGRLTLNGSFYFIEWTDPQVASATENGLIPITKNGEAAETIGFEISFDADITDRLSVRGSFAHSEAELTAPVERLVPFFVPPAMQSDLHYEDGQPGDRLPGSPENLGTLFAKYDVPLGRDLDLSFNWGFVYVGDIETRVGGRGGGITLDSYTLNNAAITLEGARWGVTLYAENIFDEFVESGARATPLYNQERFDINGDPVFVRSHYTDILPPRAVGVRFHHRFGG